MKIRQELIDNIVSLDLTREELAKQLLTARYTGLKHKAEAEWLDKLADMLRDDEPTVNHKRIYDKYQNRLTDLMDTYRDRSKES
jgi:hypothetical protein